MFLRSSHPLPFAPLAVWLSIAVAARTVAVEAWNANRGALGREVELSPVPSAPPPRAGAEPARGAPPGPAGAEREEISRRWDELADWRVWWSLNDDPYLALKSHVHDAGTLSGSDDFFLGHGRSGPVTTGGGGGPASPGPSGPSTPSGPSSARVSASLPPGAASPTDGAVEEEPEVRFEPLSPHCTPAERELEARTRAERILRSCYPRPGERPSAMFFRFWGDNPFELASTDPLSTFGADVDTASYALARRYLREGYLPERAQVRTEEFVNYFRGDVPPPVEGTFALRTELAPSRFGAETDAHAAGRASERWMLRIALRGREVPRAERQPLALTFVVDTSGSMKSENRIELVKHALRLLVAELDARDSMAIVAFSAHATVVLPPTSAADRASIESAIWSLLPDGSTNAEAGLILGYELAHRALSTLSHSRVVLLSDGVANVGATDERRITESVRRAREAGIFLNTVGVGLGNHGDALLEQLADRGDGVCNYVDDEREARRALVEGFTSAFETIARDVKLQVELDPEQVFRYRLLGYENRAVADREFRDDRVDGGEIGAGHQVVALYELELLRRSDAPLAKVRLRWKPPTGAGRDPLEDEAREFEARVSLASATSWEGSSAGFKRSAIVAQFAELLRGSTHARNDSIEELAVEAARLDRELDDPDFTELVAMIERSIDLLRARRGPEPLERCVDSLRRHAYLRAQCDAVRVEVDADELRELEREGRELEARIHELVRESLARGPR